MICCFQFLEPPDSARRLTGPMLSRSRRQPGSSLALRPRRRGGRSWRRRSISAISASTSGPGRQLRPLAASAFAQHFAAALDLRLGSTCRLAPDPLFPGLRQASASAAFRARSAWARRRLALRQGGPPCLAALGLGALDAARARTSRPLLLDLRGSRGEPASCDVPRSSRSLR